MLTMMDFGIASLDATRTQIVDCLGLYKSENGISAVANLVLTMRFSYDSA